MPSGYTSDPRHHHELHGRHMTLSRIRTIDPLMVLKSCRNHELSGGYTCHPHQHGSRRQEGAKPEDITEESGSITDCMYPYESQAPSKSGAAAWTTNTNMISRGIADSGGPLRRSNPENEPFLLPVQGLSLQLINLQAVVRHSTDTMRACRPHPSLSSVTSITSPALPLSIANTPLWFSLLPTSLSLICS